MKKRIMLITVLLIISGLTGIAKAASDEDVAALKQQMAEMQAKIAQMEEKQSQQNAASNIRIFEVEKKISEAGKKQASGLPDSLKWAENVKFSGDLRYRHESIDAQSSGVDQPGTNHHRIRARLGLDAKVNDEWDLGFRIATGSDSNPNSTNQTLDNGFTKKDIWLDLAYFNYHPKFIDRLNVYGGKMPNPFYKAGNNTLIWDDDVNPEGIAAKYMIPFGDNDKLYVNAGGLWLKEDTSAAGGSALWGAQTYLKHEFENKNYLLGGASIYAFSGLEGKGTLFNNNNGYGNTVTTTGAGTAQRSFYTMDYNVCEAFGEYGFKVMGLPAAAYGNYVKNTAATNSEDTAWLLGGTFNKAKDPGSWEVGYNYREVDKDAVLGLMTDSDFVGGGTNGKGHMFSFKYQLTKNIQTALTYFLTKKGDNEDDYRRLMADLVFKF